MREKKLKCFIGNYDGRRRGLVLAHTQAEAAKIIRSSYNHFKNYWYEEKREEWIPKGLKENTLYTQSINISPNTGNWWEGNCEIPVYGRWGW